MTSEMRCVYCCERKIWTEDFPLRIEAHCWGCWLDHNLGRRSLHDDVLAR